LAEAASSYFCGGRLKKDTWCVLFLLYYRSAVDSSGLVECVAKRIIFLKQENMKHTLTHTAEDRGFFITTLPGLVWAAKAAVLPRGRKKLKFELMRERYRLVQRQKRRRGVRIGWSGRQRSRFSHRPIMVRYLG